MRLLAPTRVRPTPTADRHVDVLDDRCDCPCRRRSGGWRHTDDCAVVAVWDLMADAIRRGQAHLEVTR